MKKQELNIQLTREEILSVYAQGPDKVIDSHNSHKPPSSEGFKKKNNCVTTHKKKRARRAGGEKGHPEKTLSVSEDKVLMF